MQDNRAENDDKNTETDKLYQGNKNFYGFKCYFDKIIKDVKMLGDEMDDITKEYLMKTPFAGFLVQYLRKR